MAPLAVICGQVRGIPPVLAADQLLVRCVRNLSPPLLRELAPIYPIKAAERVAGPSPGSSLMSGLEPHP